MQVEKYHKLQTLFQEIERTSLKTSLIALEVLAIDSQANIRPIQLVRRILWKKKIIHKIETQWIFHIRFILKIGHISFKKRLMALKVPEMDSLTDIRLRWHVLPIFQQKLFCLLNRTKILAPTKT